MWTVTQRKLFRIDKLAAMSFIVLSIWGISLFLIVPAGTKYFGPLSSFFGLLSEETYIFWWFLGRFLRSILKHIANDLINYVK